jgi:hypothetical protein
MIHLNNKLKTGKMKKTILLSLLVLFIGSLSFAQTIETASATYNAGDIGTTHLFRYDGDVSPCPGQLNVPVPDGAIVLTVDVTYEMTASSPQRRVDQRSQLWCTSSHTELIIGKNRKYHQ